MAVQGISARDFFDLARFAWLTYENVRKSRENFANLNVDVECLLVTVGSLDKGHTGKLVLEYIDGDPSLQAPDDRGEGGIRPLEDLSQRQVEIRALRDGLHSVVFPFYAFLEKHLQSFPDARPQSGNSDEGRGVGTSSQSPSAKTPRRTSLRPLDKGAVGSLLSGIGLGPGTGIGADGTPRLVRTPSSERAAWIKLPLWMRRLYTSFDLKDMVEIRSRFAVQAANLNLFLTRLTHAQMQKQTELLTLRLSEEQLLSGNWEYSHDLRNGDIKFRQHVAAYVHHLLNGGLPLTEQELRSKAVKDRFAQRRREERLWAEEKIAKEDALRRLQGVVATKARLSPELRRYEDDDEYLKDSDPRLGREREHIRLDRMERKSKDSRSRSPLELTLDGPARKVLYDARYRLDAAEREGLLDEDTDAATARGIGYEEWRRIESSSSDSERKKDDIRRRSSPGITITTASKYDDDPGRRSEPVLSSPAKTRPSEDMQRTSSFSGTPVTVRPAEPVGPSPMQHSMSASPRIRPSTPLRTVSTPGVVVPPGASYEQGSTQEPRSPNNPVRICDQCNARIHVDEWFYKCSTGNCAGQHSFDLCRKCYSKGYRCRGRDAGTCGPMICMAIKPRETAK